MFSSIVFSNQYVVPHPNYTDFQNHISEYQEQCFDHYLNTVIHFHHNSILRKGFDLPFLWPKRLNMFPKLSRIFGIDMLYQVLLISIEFPFFSLIFFIEFIATVFVQ